jgi:hypothetical protein
MSPSSPVAEAFLPKVVLVVFSDGERCPMLLDEDGVPLFDPTAWSITKFRHKSASTMEQSLRGAMLVHLFCWRNNIDLPQRFRDGTFFEIGELDALVADACKPFAILRKLAKRPTNVAVLPRKRAAVGLLRRLPPQSRGQSVDPETTRIRLYYATSYLKWLGERQKFRLSIDAAGIDDGLVRSQEYASRLAGLVEQLEERAPSAAQSGRISLNAEQRARLLAVADPDNPENPWCDEFVRLRNWWIVCWLLGTGMHRGELLGLGLGTSIAVRDTVKSSAATITSVRRAGDN